MIEIIEKLLEYRLKNGIPQEKLAEMLGVSFSTVNRWFNDKHKPSHMQIYKIQKLLEEDQCSKLGITLLK
jgi:transcriptional regulator with XRE-family HTH domain